MLRCNVTEPRAGLGRKCLSPGEGTHFGKDAEDPGHPSYPCGDGRKVEGISVELRGITLQTASLTEDVGPCDSILLFQSAFKPVLPGARPQTLSSAAQLCLALCSLMDCSTPGLLSITSFQSLLKLMFIALVIPPNHLILCRPLLLLPSIFPNIKVFSNESVICIRWPKY